ncbi:MAG: CoA pyrophosphatase [Sediminimonas qiaohouensis]|uniref:CoA pyrophosphatase n=1 Tax=Sediminimonas qiaohouensis TaxID=552061 RepID=A0A7C9LB07_9RHOB|nr:CoA pyrophosphatase [Sediminimonas qiaohouensis]MTJ04697.1 CoA pyrophosphatase [Sediminimonas qiaohouensis]
MQVTTTDSFAPVLAALAHARTASSDFDLNPDVALPAERKLRPAGVLVALQETAGGLHVILTKRSSALKHHPGQIAFPGGKQDAGDADLTATALREAHEEIALHPDNVEVLGLLPPHETVTGFIVTPVLAKVHHPFQAIPEPGEVEEVFEVPLAHVANPSFYQVQSRRWRGQERRYYSVPYGPYYIWGATARMLRTLADGMARA